MNDSKIGNNKAKTGRNMLELLLNFSDFSVGSSLLLDMNISHPFATQTLWLAEF